MKIIKSIFKFIILSLLFILLFLFTFHLYTSMKQDEVDQPTTPEDSKPLSFTESPVQPIRKTYNEDYALRLMSVPRKNITDINVINDYDATLSKLQYNVNNNVATFKDKEILRVYYNIQEEQNNE